MVAIANEFLAYLERQIDPRDPLNPRYAHIRKQIEATRNALVLVYLTTAPIVMEFGSGGTNRTYVADVQSIGGMPATHT